MCFVNVKEGKVYERVWSEEVMMKGIDLLCVLYMSVLIDMLQAK